MNVHRHDHFGLNQTPCLDPNSSPTNFPNTNSTLLIQNQEFIQNGGLCLLYSMPTNPNGIFNPSKIKSSVDPSNLLSTSLFLSNNLMSSCTPSSKFHVNQPQRISPSFDTSEPSAFNSTTSNDNNRDTDGSSKRDSAFVVDEIDLELRLG
ncbi:hypothetical protein RND71_005839 [Anisodus tanguticus]|uniref:Uncharacterized protein n=1 Tax=Anisodus tanguticus TaxID=243964 RepID=A0AAE1SSA5_9SOLA|nr:hypothetical protein RND71_005839 [Anisodus tanguticus]